MQEIHCHADLRACFNWKYVDSDCRLDLACEHCWQVFHWLVVTLEGYFAVWTPRNREGMHTLRCFVRHWLCTLLAGVTHVVMKSFLILAMQLHEPWSTSGLKFFVLDVVGEDHVS